MVENTKEIELVKPFQGESGAEITKVSVRAAQFADIEMLGVRRAEELEQLPVFKKLMSSLTGLGPKDISSFDMRDYVRVAAACNSFLGFGHHSAT